MEDKYEATETEEALTVQDILGDLYSRFPEDWVVAQEGMFADSTTIMAYNANMM